MLLLVSARPRSPTSFSFPQVSHHRVEEKTSGQTLPLTSQRGTVSALIHLWTASRACYSSGTSGNCSNPPGIPR